MSCDICKRDRAPHAVDTRCISALADRVAKLEARLDFSVNQGAWSLSADNVESPSEPPKFCGVLGCVRVVGVDGTHPGKHFADGGYFDLPAPALTAEQPEPRVCGARDLHSPRVCDLPPGHVEIAHDDSLLPTGTTDRLPGPRLPPAPAQGAPAEPLSEPEPCEGKCGYSECAEDLGHHLESRRALMADVTALESRLAAAERERDEAARAYEGLG